MMSELDVQDLDVEALSFPQILARETCWSFEELADIVTQQLIAPSRKP